MIGFILITESGQVGCVQRTEYLSITQVNFAFKTIKNK